MIINGMLTTFVLFIVNFVLFIVLLLDGDGRALNAPLFCLLCSYLTVTGVH